MQRIALKEICEIYDGPHATPKKITEGPIYLGIDAITSDGKIDYSQCAHLSEEDYKKWTKRVTPQQGDIVFSYEATLGRYALIPEEFYGCLGRRLAVVRNKSENINTSWLYYYFRSPEWTAFIQQQIVKGSTVNRISVEDFPEYTVPVMSIEEQKSIAEILSIIDRKIELNRLVNDNLQQQLKLLYDYWFTQFDFPDENGKPYRSSGNPMVWNENLKRNIPQQWHCAYLKDILQPAGEQICNIKSHEELFYTPIDIIPKHTISFAGGLPSEDAKSSLQIYRKNNLLLGAMRVYFHRVCIAAQDGITRTTTMILSPVKDMNYLGYCYSVLNSDDTILYATRHSSGTQQPYINWTDALENYAFAMPDSKELIDRYSQIAAPLIEEAQKREQENLELTQLRDWLLPMLMNGQATISD